MVAIRTGDRQRRVQGCLDGVVEGVDAQLSQGRAGTPSSSRVAQESLAHQVIQVVLEIGLECSLECVTCTDSNI